MHETHDLKKPNFLKGAAILAATGIFVKIIGALYKLPLFRLMGDEGTGYFQATYNVYALLLAISTAGIPVAMSRLVSSAAARGDTSLAKRYFSVAMPVFIAVGIIVMLAMFIFANELAQLMNSTLAVYGIRVLSPAVFFVCMIAVFRGYAQGFENMIPTAASQIVEVLSKAVIGIILAFLLVRFGYEAQYVSAGAITGVTIGLGLCIPLMMWYKRKIDRSIVRSDESGISVSSNSPELPERRGTNGSLNTSEPNESSSRTKLFLQIMKVSIPITLCASFMSIMLVIDASVVSDRLQTILKLTESEAMAQYGVYAKGLSIYNLPPSLIVPLAVSIIPAIAGAIARKSRDEASIITQASVKLTNLVAMPACAGIMVLAGPILKALYYDPRQSPETVATMTTILVILGAASYFVCFQHLTIAVLQANGHERVPLMTFPVGAILKIAISYYLVANPDIGIVGTAIGTLTCFAVITSLNVIFITMKIKERMKVVNGFLKPLFCAIIMAATAYLTYEGAYMLGSGLLGTNYKAVIVYLALAILTGVIVYTVLIVITRTITKEDLSYVPKGEKLAKILKVK